jgi:hypothetical protein
LCEENLNIQEKKIKSTISSIPLLLEEEGKTTSSLNKDLLDFYSSKEIFTILDSIDFYSEYDTIFPKLSQFLVFLSI